MHFLKRLPFRHTHIPLISSFSADLTRIQLYFVPVRLSLYSNSITMEKKLSPCATQHEKEIGTESLKQTPTLSGKETSSYCQGLKNRKEEEGEKLDGISTVEQSSNNCTTRPTFSDLNSEQPMDKDDAELSTYPSLHDTDQKRVSRRDEHEQRKLLLHSSGQDFQEGGLAHNTHNSTLDDGDIVIFPSQVKVCRFSFFRNPSIVSFKE